MPLKKWDQGLLALILHSRHKKLNGLCGMWELHMKTAFSLMVIMYLIPSATFWKITLMTWLQATTCFFNEIGKLSSMTDLPSCRSTFCWEPALSFCAYQDWFKAERKKMYLAEHKWSVNILQQVRKYWGYKIMKWGQLGILSHVMSSHTLFLQYFYSNSLGLQVPHCLATAFPIMCTLHR